MNEHDFDMLTRSVGQVASRRDFIKILGASAIGALLGWIGIRNADSSTEQNSQKNDHFNTGASVQDFSVIKETGQAEEDLINMAEDYPGFYQLESYLSGRDFVPKLTLVLSVLDDGQTIRSSVLRRFEDNGGNGEVAELAYILEDSGNVFSSALVFDADAELLSTYYFSAVEEVVEMVPYENSSGSLFLPVVVNQSSNESVNDIVDIGNTPESPSFPEENRLPAILQPLSSGFGCLNCLEQCQAYNNSGIDEIIGGDFFLGVCGILPHPAPGYIGACFQSFTGLPVPPFNCEETCQVCGTPSVCNYMQCTGGGQACCDGFCRHPIGEKLCGDCQTTCASHELCQNGQCSGQCDETHTACINDDGKLQCCPISPGKCCYYPDGSYSGGCCPATTICCTSPSGVMGCCTIQCTFPGFTCLY